MLLSKALTESHCGLRAGRDRISCRRVRDNAIPRTPARNLQGFYSLKILLHEVDAVEHGRAEDNVIGHFGWSHSVPRLPFQVIFHELPDGQFKDSCGLIFEGFDFFLGKTISADEPSFARDRDDVIERYCPNVAS